MLSVFITPCTKPTSIHCATSVACAADDRLEAARGRAVGRRGRRGWCRAIAWSASRRSRSVSPVAPRRTGSCRPAGGCSRPGPARRRAGRLAPHRAPGGDDGERPGGRDAEGVHRLADDVLAQHRADGGQAVAAAGERRAAGALEVQVAEPAVGVASSPSSSARPSPSRGDSRRTGGRRRPARPGCARRARRCRSAGRRPSARPQPRRVEAELGGQRLVEHEQPRVGRRLGLPGDRQLGQLVGEAVVQGDGPGAQWSPDRGYVPARTRGTDETPVARRRTGTETWRPRTREHTEGRRRSAVVGAIPSSRHQDGGSQFAREWWKISVARFDVSTSPPQGPS